MVKEKVDEAIETFIDNPSLQVSYHDLIMCLCELNKKDFKRIIKIAKLERKSNELFEQYFSLEN